jgi:DNA-binding response OmpR family regulator
MAKILIVEDDDAIADLLKLRLTEAGHQVFVAKDGMAGPMMAAREKPDLVLLDFNMPAANGGKVLERLRGSTFTAATPVIFVTASPVADIMTQLPDDPKVRFVQKPVDFAVLDRLVRESLGAPAPRPAIPPPGAPLPPLGEPPPAPADDGPLSLD